MKPSLAELVMERRALEQLETCHLERNFCRICGRRLLSNNRRGFCWECRNVAIRKSTRDSDPGHLLK